MNDFLDDDERADLDAKGLQASSTYDTFAVSSEAALRGRAQTEAAERHGVAAAGLNLYPAVAIKPVHLSVGMLLLQKMGWRPVRCA